MVTAYLKKEGATLYSGVHNYSFQHEDRLGWCFGMRVVTWTKNSLSGKGGEVLRKRIIDVYCWQEVKWSGQGSKMLRMEGRIYKLWWSG